jgi:hypothetical protein
MGESRSELRAADNPDLQDRRAQRMAGRYPEYRNWAIPAYPTQAFLNRHAGAAYAAAVRFA